MSISEFPNVNKSPSIDNKKHIAIGANQKLSVTDAKLLASQPIAVKLAEESHDVMNESYQFLKTCIDQRMPIYGINTHFGDQVSFLDPYLKNTDIEQTEYYASINNRQKNLIKSHACALGEIVRPEIIKIAMMLRAHCLSQGYSGVSKQAIDAILSFINAGITPIVRRYGSIGASGDLIPLASIAAGLIGEEVDVLYKGQLMKAPEAIALAGLQQFTPALRDGLAMINGTSFMTAIASFSLSTLNRLFPQMLAAIGMSLEAMLVISSGYNPLVHQLKRQVGENTVNEFLLNFWADSRLLTDLDELRSANTTETSGNESETRSVQDYYSLRAVAQGFGPFEENLIKANAWIENEMNSINDNPIIDAAKKKIHHSANFMGYYITDACDMLKMDIAQASTWMHALLANLVHSRKNHGLPVNLVDHPGTQNGFRPIQLLTDALTIQNRKLAQAHQAYMLPTEGDNQDVNSLGTHAAFDLQEAVTNLERITAILLLAATQALEYRGIEKAGKKSQHIYHVIRNQFPKLKEDRPLSEEIAGIVSLLDKETI
jgi:histidine ammonia-lyase